MTDNERKEFEPTEVILLLRQGSKTMAVHMPKAVTILTALVDYPDIFPTTGFYAGPTVTGYQVEAEGVADRVYMWEGADPFGPRAELGHDHRMGVTCPACGHQTPRRAVLA